MEALKPLLFSLLAALATAGSGAISEYFEHGQVTGGPGKSGIAAVLMASVLALVKGYLTPKHIADLEPNTAPASLFGVSQFASNNEKQAVKSKRKGFGWAALIGTVASIGVQVATGGTSEIVPMVIAAVAGGGVGGAAYVSDPPTRRQRE